MESRKASDRPRPAADSHHRPLISRRRARMDRLRAHLASLIGSRYHMIRSIDAHLALKKLRESVPEVNAPENDQTKSFSAVRRRSVLSSPDRDRCQCCSAATSLATAGTGTVLLPSQMSQIAGHGVMCAGAIQCDHLP